MTMRETAERFRWMTWVILIVLAAAAAWLLSRQFRSDEFSAEFLSEKITIRCAETGFEWPMERARLREYLFTASNSRVLDPKIGIENPKTRKQTGFPVDRAYWDRLVTEINDERAEFRRKRSSGS